MKTTNSSKRDLDPFALWLERGIVAAMFLFVVAAPNSIAGAQSAWMLGLLFWVIRFWVWPRPQLYRTPLDYFLFGFFLLSALSSFFSYAPMSSIGKLRAASLFTIVYLFAENVRSARVLRALAITLVAACMVSVFFTFGQYALGRGVKLHGVARNSPLAEAKFVVPRKQITPTPIISEDTIEEVNGRKVNSLEELVAALESSPAAKTAEVRIYRVEWNPVLEVPRGHLFSGSTSEERLGIQSWTYGRDRRATGFFGHWTTYAEALQLIASLVIGLLLALPKRFSKRGLLLLLALIGISAALLFSVTRASWLSLIVSGALIAALSVSRRTLILIGVCMLPVVVAGLFVLQQKRNVGFFDKNDDSIRWRKTVQTEGFHLLTRSPRHLLVGVGMDSVKAHWREWGLFDNGRIPMGHMHSDYLQIALERGVPALIVWLLLMVMYGRMLWRLRLRIPAENWIEKGIVLGALGGLVGFLLSGLVHYNWGDSEVVMLFYLIMGLSLVVERQTRQNAPATES